MATIRTKRGFLYLDYRDEAGKRHRDALYLKDNRENRKKAELEKKKIEYELGAGVYIEKLKRDKLQTLSLLQGLMEFLEIKNDKKETTKNCYKLAAEKFIKHMGDMKLYNIDRSVVYTFINRLKYEMTRFKKQTSMNSVATYNNQLKVMFQYFKERGYVKENPFQHREIKIKEIVTMQDKEIEDIIYKLKGKNIEHYKVISFLLLTGLRCSEIINITFSNIDFNNNIIYVRNEKEDRQDRIPLHPILKEFILNEWDTFEGKLFNYKSRHSLHFFKRFLINEGYERYSLHTLRKTFITKLINSGLSIYDVMTLARHKNIKTTLKHYANAELIRMGNEIKKQTNLGTLLGTQNKKGLKLIKIG